MSTTVSRKWKPGDVAVNVYHGYRGIYVRDCTMHNRSGCWHNESGLADAADVIRRPLVVIDPEDREQVERLADANERAIPDGLVTPTASTDAMQAALRSLLAPEKPDEPLGLGAVIEDAEGNHWVRVSMRFRLCAGEPLGRYRLYSEIAAVSVLSEGVTA